MTNSFILFIFGMFEDTEDIEFYCNEILLENPAVKSLRFIVENSKNLIVILESDKTQKELSKSLHKDLLDQNVKFYFIFRRDEIVSAHIPEQVKKFIYASSSSVYGLSKKQNVTEEHVLKPLTDYSKYKVACEIILKKHVSEL